MNEEQEAYCASLALLPPDSKCYCGWYALGKCPNCPPGKTLAHRIAARCPECHNAPPPDGSRPNVHIRGCSAETPEERTYYRDVMTRGAARARGEVV